jgi:SHS2 domain-containing protein
MADWETFPHGSDIGVRGRGATIERAFENAALALTSVITDPSRVRPEQEVRVQLEGHDPEMLFFDWLDTLVFESSTRRMLFSRFEVARTAAGMDAKLFGEAIDVTRHEPAVEVKGPTLTEPP